MLHCSIINTVGRVSDRPNAQVGGPRRPPERPNTAWLLMLLNKTSSQVIRSLGCLHPQTHLILLILSYLILSSHFSTPTLTARHCWWQGRRLPLLWFLDFACGELWLPSTASVAEWLRALPPPTPVRFRASLVADDGFRASRFNRHAVPAAIPKPMAAPCAPGATTPAAITAHVAASCGHGARPHGGRQRK
jgi:hypothetical protein